jgi:N-carbamoyl-L-amino-acid hydrolase
MVFVRNDRGSHNPHEAMELLDFLAGAEVLSRALWHAANLTQEFR